VDDLIKLLVVPSLGLSVEEVTVVDWLIGEGDSFVLGDEICELETEKSVNALEAPFAGTLRQIVAVAGDVLKVQGTLALVADAAVSDEQLAAFLADRGDSATVEPTQTSAVDSPEETLESRESLPPREADNNLVAYSAGGDDSSVHATPRARTLAASAGLNLHNVSGTGRNNRISRNDVERVLTKSGVTNEGGQASPPVAKAKELRDGSVVATPLSSMRRKIASRLQQSKQTIPHYRLVIDVSMDSLTKARRNLNQRRKEKVSINDFIVKACAQALIEVPEVNIQFDGENVSLYSDADIAIAVALEGGLITPVLRAAQNKSLPDIAWQVRDLVSRAKSRSLQPDEYQGGTFCVSNLGMFGIKQFDAIINPPHGAILAVGAVRERPVVVDGQVTVDRVLTLTLSCDHRVIDGALAARFLAATKRLLENPAELQA